MGRPSLGRYWMLVAHAPSIDLAIIPNWELKLGTLHAKTALAITSRLRRQPYVDWRHLPLLSELAGHPVEWWYEPFPEPEPVTLFQQPFDVGEPPGLEDSIVQE